MREKEEPVSEFERLEHKIQQLCDEIGRSKRLIYQYNLRLATMSTSNANNTTTIAATIARVYRVYVTVEWRTICAKRQQIRDLEDRQVALTPSNSSLLLASEAAATAKKGAD